MSSPADPTRSSSSGARGATDRSPTVSTGDQGVGELLSQLSEQLTTLRRQEVELAKAETKQELREAARAGGAVGAATVTAWFAVLFLSLAAAWGLAEVVAAGVAFLVVGAVYVVVAGILAAMARRRAQRVDPALTQTQDSIKTTAEWAKDKP